VHASEVAEGLVAIGFEIVAQVIWDKGLFAIGRSWYHWNHEPCWVVRRSGAKVPFRGSRDQATIWRVPSPKMIMGGSSEATAVASRAAAQAADLVDTARQAALGLLGDTEGAVAIAERRLRPQGSKREQE
jgi:hypothetical protein